VLRGGHSIPEDVIRRRYDLSFRNLEAAIPFADEILIYDNSSPKGPQIKVEINNTKIVLNQFDMAKTLDKRLAGIVSRALGLPIPAS
jgi:predicted ABC-type ATPase